MPDILIVDPKVNNMIVLGKFREIFPYTITLPKKFLGSGCEQVKRIEAVFGKIAEYDKKDKTFTFHIREDQRWDFYDNVIYFRNAKDAVFFKLNQDKFLGL